MDTAQYDKLYWYCFRHTKHKDYARDFLHDALMKAFIKEPELFDQPEGYKKMYRYCKFHLFNKNRQKSLRSKYVNTVKNFQFIEVPSDKYHFISDFYIKELTDILIEPTEKKIFKLTWEENTCIEIGKLLQLKKDKVNKTQMKIREKLNAFL